MHEDIYEGAPSPLVGVRLFSPWKVFDRKSQCKSDRATPCKLITAEHDEQSCVPTLLCIVNHDYGAIQVVSLDGFNLIVNLSQIFQLGFKCMPIIPQNGF